MFRNMELSEFHPLSVPRVSVVLHRHALESVFAFLLLRDLHGAAQVSWAWERAVHSMRLTPGHAVKVAAGMNWAHPSRLLRHVTNQILPQGHELPLSFQDMCAALHSMPLLRNWYWCVPTDTVEGTMVDLPLGACPFLEDVVLLMAGCSGSVVNELIRAVSRCPRLRMFYLVCDNVFSQLPDEMLTYDISFAPLRAVPLLRVLHVHTRMAFLSLRQLCHISELPLTHLVANVSPKTVVEALQTKGPVQWMTLPCCVSDELALLLPSVTPCIQEIALSANFDLLDRPLSSYSFLLQMPALERILLRGDPDFLTSDRQLMQHIAKLPTPLMHATHLHLFEMSVSAATMRQFLLRTPNLKELLIVSIDKSLRPLFLDLSFLQPVAAILQLLSLSGSLEPDGISTHFNSMPSLPKLTEVCLEKLQFTSEQLYQLMERMPHLQILRIHNVKFDSLNFLQPVQSTLTFLFLEGELPPATLLPAVRTCTNLKTLLINNCSQFSDEDRAMLNEISSLRWHYSPDPMPDEGQDY